MIRERNYRKNPHTATFLLRFHEAAYGLNSDIDNERDYQTPAEQALTGGGEDLLDAVPMSAPAYQPTDRQRQFIIDLIKGIDEIDRTLGDQAQTYTMGMDENGRWTPEKVSAWIERLIAKRDALRAEVAKKTAPVQVENGRYAVTEDGELKFFKVTNGRRPGFVFLDIQASDDWHSIRNVTRIRSILALIAEDPKAAMARYGQEIGECGRCGRTLTSEYRKLGIGPVCIDK